MSDINEIISQSAIDGLLKAAQAAQVLDSAITAINKSQSSLAEKTKMLNDTQKEAEKLTKEQTAATAALDKQRQKAYEQMAKEEAKERELIAAINMEVKSIQDAQRQTDALQKVKKKLDLTTADGIKKNKEYNAIIQKNTAFINQNADAETRRHMGIGKYKEAIQGMGTKLLALGAAFGVTVGAAKILQGIFSSTEAIADSFAKKTEGLKQGFEFLGRSIATLDFNNLISGFRNAFREGERYAEVLDEIEDRERSLGIRKTNIEGQILDQKKIAKAAWSTTEQKQAAIDEIIRLQQVERDETFKLENDKLNNFLDNAAQITGADKNLIRGLVENKDAYKEKLEEAAKLQSYLNSLITESTIISGDQVMMVKNTDEYDKALKNLTPDQKELIDLLRIENTLTGEKRDNIAEGIKGVNAANNAQKQGELELSKFKNSLYNELIGQEDDKQKAILNTAKASEDAEKVAEANIKDFEAALNSGFNQIDESIDNTEANIKGFEDAMSLGSVFAENADQFEASLNTMKDNLKGFEDAMAESGEATTDTFQSQFDKRIAIAQEYTQQVSAIGQTLLDFNQFLIDTEVSKMEQAKAYELQMAGDNAAKKAEIEKKYEKEAAKLKAKQAKQDKASALFAAIIKTAQAVLSGLAYGPPLGYIFAALNAALGAVQIGVIASQPIPQFAKGTKSARKGLAWVGEKGQELIFGKDGVMMSPGQATLMNLKGGERILSNQDTKRLMAAAKGADDYYSRKLLDQMHADNLQLIETVKNKPVLHIDRKGNRVSERSGNYFRTYLDRKL